MGKLKAIIRKLRIKSASNEQFIELLRKEGMKIGSGCSIAKSIVIGDEPWLVSIGNNTRLTRNVQLITHDGSIWTLRKMELVGPEDVLYGRISIGDNCNIGWNTMILPNVKIGNNCIIAANATVTKDIPDNSVVAGTPAKVIKQVDDYYKKHKDELIPAFSLTKKEKQRLLETKRPEWFEIKE